MRAVSMSPMCAFVALWIAACVLVNVGSADSQATAQLVSRKVCMNKTKHLGFHNVGLLYHMLG